jgi:cobalt-zinc-cadmium efflux system outer membrane protein
MLCWLVLVCGCDLTTASQVDREVQQTAARLGIERVRSEGLLPPPPPPPRLAPLPTLPGAAKSAIVPAPRAVIQLAFLEEQESGKPPRQPLVIPPDLPGATAPAIQVPENRAARRRVLDELYPPIPLPPPLPRPAPGPEGQPLTLADLQRLAETYSPAIKNAFAALQAARGAAYQAGQYPNPSIAFEHDTVETGPAGYPGFYIDQVVKTGGKLTVAQAAAAMDVLNAQVALRRARSDAWYAVRGSYFAVLVALENMRVSEALFRFTDRVYRVQIDLVESADAAAYEPMQLRPLVLQAQLNLIQAQNQYAAAWRQLAVNLGLPDMPPTELDGDVDLPVPVFEYNEILARLSDHTDVLTSRVSIEKAKYSLKLQRLQPLPDVELRLLVQKDFSTPPNQVAHSAVFSAQVPLWDRNRGAIRQSEWLLAQASVGPEQARNALINTLADAFNRYQTARRTVDIVGQQVRDQVRVYRGVRERRERVPGQVSFGDVVTAEQTLSGYISSYVTALGSQWQAVVDLANLLQTEDLFQAGRQLQPVEPLPDLKHLLPPPAPNVPECGPRVPAPRPAGATCASGSSSCPPGIAAADETLPAPAVLEPKHQGESSPRRAPAASSIEPAETQTGAPATRTTR